MPLWLNLYDNACTTMYDILQERGNVVLPLTIRIPSAMKRELKRRAKAKGQNLSVFIRGLLKEN